MQWGYLFPCNFCDVKFSLLWPIFSVAIISDDIRFCVIFVMWGNLPHHDWASLIFTVFLLNKNSLFPVVALSNAYNMLKIVLFCHIFTSYLFWVAVVRWWCYVDTYFHFQTVHFTNLETMLLGACLITNLFFDEFCYNSWVCH